MIEGFFTHRLLHPYCQSALLSIMGPLVFLLTHFCQQIFLPQAKFNTWSQKLSSTYHKYKAGWQDCFEQLCSNCVSKCERQKFGNVGPSGLRMVTPSTCLTFVFILSQFYFWQRTCFYLSLQEVVSLFDIKRPEILDPYISIMRLFLCSGQSNDNIVTNVSIAFIQSYLWQWTCFFGMILLWAVCQVVLILVKFFWS